MTNKDKEITAVALEKSIIESGIPQEQWEESLKEALRIFINVTNAWKQPPSK